MRKLMLMLLAYFVSNLCFALQIKSAVNHETINANISATDVTRILVQGDRIQSVKGIKGAYTRENDNQNGEIYLQPTPSYQQRAFTVLINTELGRHYTLLLNPMDVPTGTLMLVPKGVGEIKAAKFETTSSYDLTITHLIKAMRSGNLPDGYIIKEGNHKTRYSYDNMASLTLKTVYEGLNLRGEIWEINNTKPDTIILDERAFYKSDTRAISFETINVASRGKTYLYRVMSNG